jgi:hypothetical protein
MRMAEISEPDNYVFNHTSEYFTLLKDDLSNTK